MSLRIFHLLFIACSTALAVFVAAWAFSRYQADGGAGDVVTAAVSVAAGIGLAAYGAAFQRKSRRLLNAPGAGRLDSRTWRP